jgi:hypothetical protein
MAPRSPPAVYSANYKILFWSSVVRAGNPDLLVKLTSIVRDYRIAQAPNPLDFHFHHVAVAINFNLWPAVQGTPQYSSNQAFQRPFRKGFLARVDSAISARGSYAMVVSPHKLKPVTKLGFLPGNEWRG